MSKIYLQWIFWMFCMYYLHTDRRVDRCPINNFVNNISFRCVREIINRSSDKADRSIDRSIFMLNNITIHISDVYIYVFNEQAYGWEISGDLPVPKLDKSQEFDSRRACVLGYVPIIFCACVCARTYVFKNRNTEIRYVLVCWSHCGH